MSIEGVTRVATAIVFFRRSRITPSRPQHSSDTGYAHRGQESPYHRSAQDAMRGSRILCRVRKRFCRPFSRDTPCVPNELFRYYLYWRILPPHSRFPFFAPLLVPRLGVYFMVVFSIFSVVILVAASLLLTPGYDRLGYLEAIMKLIPHGIAAPVCVGT